MKAVSSLIITTDGRYIPGGIPEEWVLAWWKGEVSAKRIPFIPEGRYEEEPFFEMTDCLVELMPISTIGLS